MGPTCASVMTFLPACLGRWSRRCHRGGWFASTPTGVGSRLDTSRPTKGEVCPPAPEGPSGLATSMVVSRKECGMTTFTVWKFDTPEGAGHAESMLKDAEADGLVKVVDHAVVSWPQGEGKPVTSHADTDTKRGAAWGA